MISSLSSSLSASSKPAGWYDSLLDLLVWVGFPAAVPRMLFPADAQQAPLHAASLFVVRALNRHGSGNGEWERRYAAGNQSAAADPAVPLWCNGMSSVLRRICNEGLQQQQQQQRGGKDPFCEAAVVPVTGTEAQRRVFLSCADGATRVEFQPFGGGGGLVETDAESGSRNAASTANARRCVDAVVNLIVDGVNSRAARAVLQDNTAVTTHILASLGLCTAQQQQQQQQQGTAAAATAATTVNGLLWTTLGSRTLQRCVLLQAAVFYVLTKYCGVAFELDEATDRWRFRDAPAREARSGGASVSQSIASIVSAVLALCTLDEDAWYVFPRQEPAVGGLLFVLNVLGFVALQRRRLALADGGSETLGLFRVLPELRDAALARGAVETSSNAAPAAGLDPRLLRAVATGGAGGGGRHIPATTDCVVVETNFRVYVHLVPRTDPRTGAQAVSHQGQTLLAVLRRFLDQEELILPVFAVFRLTRESYFRALRDGLTSEAILRFLEAKAHPMAVAHYSAAAALSSSSSSAARNGGKQAAAAVTGVPKALKDQMAAWGREAERVRLRPHHILLTFPSSAMVSKMLRVIHQRSGAAAAGAAAVGTSDAAPLLDNEKFAAAHVPSVMVPNAFQLVLPEKLWPLISDLLPAQ